MILRPEYRTVADIGINLGELPYNVYDTLTPLARGLNSRVYRVGEDGDRVLKASRSAGPVGKMTILGSAMAEEYAMSSDYIDPTMISETSYNVARTLANPDRARIVIGQGFVDGPFLRTYIRLPGAKLDGVAILLEAAIDMYEEEKKIPDLAKAEHGFNVFRNKNVLVRDVDGQMGVPILVDTSYGTIQRSRLAGGKWASSIYKGVKRGLRTLEGH
jgi:hypothetical protein